MKSQSYIVATLFIFVSILGIFMYPYKSYQAIPNPHSDKCIAGSPPSNSATIQLPVINFPDGTYYAKTDEYIYWATPDPTKLVEYIPIRSNVVAPQENTSNLKYWHLLGGSRPSDGEYAHTRKIGEYPGKPGYDLYYPNSVGEINIKNEPTNVNGLGLVFFVSKKPGATKSFNDKTYYTMDVYQKLSEYQKPSKNYTLADLFPCLDDPDAKALIQYVPFKTNIVIPEQKVSLDNQQLQLEWFVFQKEGVGGVWGIHCKPAVYLYPQQKQLINIKVFPKGELSYTDPKYDQKTGWTVEANPDGALTTTYNLQPTYYPYLYYESKIKDEYIKKPTSGWVVKPSEIQNLYNDILPKLGLNEKEQADFIHYWTKALPESPYYFVGLIDKSQRDYLEPLTVTPPPDTSIRFSLYFELLKKPIKVLEPKITTPLRKGFTLVDWGGMIKRYNDTEFTCSQ